MNVNRILIGLALLSSPAFAAESPCDTNDVGRCAIELQEKMSGARGVTDVREWKSVNAIVSADWYLTQVHNGFAMFQTPYKRLDSFIIGIKDDSISKPLKKGVTLYDTVRCLKWLADTDTVDDKGFKVDVKLYRQVACE